MDGPGADPFAVRMRGGQLPLDGAVVEHASRSGVDEQEPAGLEPPLADDALLGNVEHAGLRRHDDEAVIGDQIPSRAQAVAIERRADDTGRR